MPRFKLTIEYDGGPFSGWQRQADEPTIQQALEDAIFGFTREWVLVEGAGRTDAGVHATGQVAHVDIATERYDAFSLPKAINAHLKPQPVAVVGAEIVNTGFHARFSAVERAYRYVIVNRRAPLTVDTGRAWQVPRPLDIEAMRAGAVHLIGHHDFTTFRSVHCQSKSPEKTLDLLEISRSGERIEVVARARSFLHHQVRNIVGTLKLVGEGKWSADQVRTARDARDRTKGGPTAPADGLYLTDVIYPLEAPKT